MVQASTRHWILAIAIALALHAAAMLRYSAPDNSVSAEDLGAQSITIALAPPPTQTARPQPPKPVAPIPEPQVSPLESAVKTPEPEPEPESEPEPRPEPVPEPEPQSEPVLDMAELEADENPNERVSEQSAKVSAERSQAGATGGIQDAPPDYRDQVSAWLERHKEYPLNARRKAEQGMAMVSFTFDREGRVLDYQLQRPTGHANLDRAVEEMLERADPLPPMPSHIPHQRMTWTLPVYFRLNTG